MKGKKCKRDVQEFQLDLMSNIFGLHRDLANKTYKHGRYKAFNISDPKPRNIHKASVRDRLLHHAIYRVLYPYFDQKFIHDSYSCRLNKGIHKAMERFRIFGWKVSKNNTKTCWILKCDIKKFFASINHKVLQYIVTKHLRDRDTNWLIFQVVKSFNSGVENKGLPLGNLTSQLLVNIYMNEFDQFIKHKLRVKHYIRYADDFIVTTIYRSELEKLLSEIRDFLQDRLSLTLHPDKISIKTLASGVDFLGWTHFPDHRILRTTTRRRMFKNLAKNQSRETLASYLGMLKHGNTYKIRKKLMIYSFE